MKIEPLKLGEITAKLPVIQGGMGVGISLGGLAGLLPKREESESFPQHRLDIGNRILTGIQSGQPKSDNDRV